MTCALLIGMMLLACAPRGPKAPDPNLAAEPANETLDTEFSPDRFGVFTLPGGGRLYTAYADLGTHAFVDGDLLLPLKRDAGSSKLPSATIGSLAGLWPGREIPYELDTDGDCGAPPELHTRTRPIYDRLVFKVRDAMEMWAGTVIRFVPHTTQPDYLEICMWDRDNPHSEFVGRMGGRQRVWLSTGARTGSVAHELGHVIGLYHEQQRMDRDDHVRINYDCIKKGKEGNYNSYAYYLGEVVLVGRRGRDIGPYDYRSIMHYPRRGSFSTGCEVISPIQAGIPFGADIGQRDHPSRGDIDGVNILYRGGRSETSFPAAYDTAVAVFARPQLGGRFQLLSASRYLPTDLSELVGPSIRSVRVPAGVVVKLCAGQTEARCVRTDTTLETLDQVSGPIDRVELYRAVTIFDGPELTGTRRSFVTGRHHVSGIQVRSLLVPPGLHATLCRGSTCTPVATTTPSVTVAAVDSIEVRAAVTLYDRLGYDSNHEGTSITVLPGSHDLRQLGLTTVQSLIAGFGLRVELCAGDACELFLGDVAAFLGRAVDRVVITPYGSATPPAGPPDNPPVEPDEPDGPVPEVCRHKPWLCERDEDFGPKRP